MEKQRISRAQIRSECQEKQRHGVEKLSPDQKCKGTDMLAKKRIRAEKRGFASRRAATVWHSWYAEKCNDKQRHGMDSMSVAMKRTGQARKKTEA